MEIEYAELPQLSSENKGSTEIMDLRLLKVGSGSRIFQVDKEAVKLGSASLDTAKIVLNYDGSAIFKTPTGTKIIDSDSETGDYLEVLNRKLNTATKTILQGFTFEAGDYAGNLYSGNITWNASTGLPTGGTGFLINSRGILGVKDGATKVSILNDGNATFAGALSAATGTFAGKISAGGVQVGNLDNTHYGLSLNGTTDFNNIFLKRSDGVVFFRINQGGASSLTYDSSSGNLAITGGSITGATIQTGASGYRSVMSSDNGFQCFNGSTLNGIMKADSGASLTIASLDNIYFRKLNNYEYARFVDTGLQLANGTAFRWSNGREIKDRSSWVSINGTFSSNSDETDDLGGSSTKWRNTYSNKFYQQASSGGDASVFDFAYVEMGLLPKKMIKKHLGGIDGKGLRRIDNVPEKSIKLPFKIGTVLCWYNGKLKQSLKDMDKRYVAIANDRGLPIVLGAELVRVKGKVKLGDFIVPTTNGLARAEKNPSNGTIIGKALESKKTFKEGLIKVMIK